MRTEYQTVSTSFVFIARVFFSLFFPTEYEERNDGGTFASRLSFHGFRQMPAGGVARRGKRAVWVMSWD